MIKYQVSTYLRASLPRSQRLRAISYNPGSTNSSSAETHRHDNKAVLDALTEVDGDGYLHIKFIKEGSSVTEKVKAGYADKWGGWEFGDFFERVNVGSDECPIYALRVKMGLFSDSFVSSKGISKDIGDSAIGINLSSVWESLTSNVDTFKNSKIHIDHLPILTADDISNLSTFVDDAIKATTISQFYNDAGFITASSIINKADKATTLAGYGITDAIPYKELRETPYRSSVGYGYPSAGFKTAGGFVAAVHHGGQYGFALQGENGNSGLYYRGMVAGVWNETWRTIAFTDTKVDNAKNADSLGTYSSDKYMRGFVDGTIDVNSNVFDWNRPYIWRTTSNPNTPINHAHILHVTASGSDGAFELCGAMNEDKLLFRRGSMSTDSTQATLYKNAWKEIAFAATTLAGYGITDAMPYIGTVDANSVKSSGYAYVTSNGAGGNGGLISFGGTSYQTQLYADYLGKDLYWRANSNGTYTTWQKIATKGTTLAHYGITDALQIGADITAPNINVTAHLTANSISATKISGITNTTMVANLHSQYATNLVADDNRGANEAPYEYNTFGLNWRFKTDTAIGLNGLGGVFSGVLELTPWKDRSGGPAHQLAFESNGNILHRYGVTAWQNWRKLAFTDEVVKIGADITAPNINVTGSATFANGDISIGSNGLIMNPVLGFNIGDYLTVNGGTTEIWGDFFKIGAYSTIFYNSVNINGNVYISSMIRTNSDTGILSLDGNYIDVYAPINIKSTMKIGEATLYWDSTNKMLKVDTGAYFIGPVSSKGVSNGEDGSFAVAQFGLYWEDLWTVDKSAYFESFGNLTNLNTISTGISNGSNIEIICDALIGKSSSDIEIHTVGLKGEAPPDVNLIPYKINGNTLTCKLFLTGSLSLVGFKIKIY